MKKRFFIIIFGLSHLSIFYHSLFAMDATVNQLVQGLKDLDKSTSQKCQFCKEYGGSPLTTEPFTREHLQHDPLFNQVILLAFQEQKNDCLRALLKKFNPHHNWEHFTYHLAAVIAGGANSNTVHQDQHQGESYVANHAWRYAVVQNRMDFAQFLIDHKTDPNAIVANLNRPLNWTHKLAMTQFLLKHGADPRKAAKDLINHMLYSANAIEVPQILALYKQYGANLLIKDNTWNALHTLAQEAGKFNDNLDALEKTVDILFKSGIDIDAQLGDTIYNSRNKDIRFKTAEELAEIFKAPDKAQASNHLINLIAAERMRRVERKQEYKENPIYAERATLIKKAFQVFKAFALSKSTKPDCSICLGEQCANFATPCNHIFCQSCITLWVNKNQTCPVCIRPLKVEDLKLLSLSGQLKNIL